MRWLAVCLVLIATPAFAIIAKSPITLENGTVGLADGTILNQIYVWDGSAFVLREFAPNDFVMTSTQETLHSDVSHFGPCAGDTSDEICDPFVLAGREIQAVSATSFSMPSQTSCLVNQTGEVCLDTDNSDIEVYDGTRLRRLYFGAPPSAVGVSNATTNFTYAAQKGCSNDGSPCAADSDCIASNTCACDDTNNPDVCRGGKCEGRCSVTQATNCLLNSDCPATETCEGVCIFTPNSFLASSNLSGSAAAVAGQKGAYIGEYDTLTVTDGVLTIDTSTDTDIGALMLLRTRGDMTISGTGTTFDLSGLGGRRSCKISGSACDPAATADDISCITKNMGKQGSYCRLQDVPTGGDDTGANNCSAGDAARFDSSLFTVAAGCRPVIIGGGGGQGPVSGGAVPPVLVSQGNLCIYGGAGGGGGGCPASCTESGSNTIAGDGGGGVVLEVGGILSCTSATFDTRGADASGSSAGGGGGGGTVAYFRELASPFTCTFSETGGAGSVSTGTCGDGCAGGAGGHILIQVPGPIDVTP